MTLRKFWIAASLLVFGTGCWSVTRIDDLGEVRVVHYYSPLGICGATDATLESREGRRLVGHVNRSSASPGGRWMAAIGWIEGSDYRLHAIDRSIPKVLLSRDLPNEDTFSSLGPEFSAWSPDGSRIICQSHPCIRKDILEPHEESALLLLSFTSDGARCEPLFRRPGRKIWNPQWSPDGLSIAFLVARGEGWSEREGWTLVQVTPGLPPTVQEIAVTGGLGEGQVVWEEGRPRFARR